MNETAEDLARLQALLDTSHERGGSHLRGIITDERRLTAEEIVARLTGMRLLVLATTTRDGRPITGMVDGFFHRGEFWFGTGVGALRAPHARAPVGQRDAPGGRALVGECARTGGGRAAA